MKDKKTLVSTILMCGGLLLAVCSIFCLFGPAMKMSVTEGIVTESATIGSVFVFMLGGTAVVKTMGISAEIPGVKATPILTVVFVIELIAIVLAIIIAIGFFTKKLESKKVVALNCILSFLMLLGAVLSLASKNAMVTAQGGEIMEGTKLSLGSGIIAYAVLGFVSVAASVASIFVSKKVA